MNQSTLLNQALLQSIHIAVNIISSGEDKPRTGGRCLHNYLPQKRERGSIVEGAQIHYYQQLRDDKGLFCIHLFYLKNSCKKINNTLIN